MADLTDQELKSLAYARHGEVFPDEIAKMVAEIRRHRASNLTEREEFLADSALGHWSSDDNDAPHEQIAELRVKLSRPK